MRHCAKRRVINLLSIGPVEHELFSFKYLYIRALGSISQNNFRGLFALKVVDIDVPYTG